MSKPDPFLAHEALDRTALMLDMVDNHLLQHAWVQMNPDVDALIKKASDALAKAYQLIGEKTL